MQVFSKKKFSFLQKCFNFGSFSKKNEKNKRELFDKMLVFIGIYQFYEDMKRMDSIAIKKKHIISLLNKYINLQEVHCYFQLLLSFISFNHINSINRNYNKIIMSDSDSSPSPPKKNNLYDKVEMKSSQIDPLELENRQLRKKLRELSNRLDQQLDKAAKQKVKPQKNINTSTQQSQQLELQNAYKMIDRLQKTVKEFQSKESYQISVKRIMDLQSIIKKKQAQNQQLKAEVKLNKKIVKEKERYISQLLQNSKKMTNPTQDKETINKLKDKMRKILTENQSLRKKQMQKHEQLVIAERKLVEIQQQDEPPIGSHQSVLNQLEEYKKKYQQAMQRVQRQNMYIVKLNERLSKEQNTQRRKSQGRKDVISRSMDELPQLRQKKIKPADILQHIPAIHAPSRLRRF